ncbi:DUF1289 domain-containing protein [Solemya velesiana gill symbiont]|uniref:DUF1289 domain-containing protein n=1 Tax=Solemya velesiana gill symbiont TaxID=1918948 RepID=A0A1T2KU06_9GAMM|nr:DUF1289 domain-containing protein [Solemya velesiana gill symbiont]OOZ36281.1 DUF1289 domain-containing protein [Solemya velesiana gill symbiont]
MQFSPCKGGDFCTQDGTHCQGCGRSHEEIAETRMLMQRVAKYAVDMDYENIEEFTPFVGEKAGKIARKLQDDQAGGGIGIGMPIK